MEAGLLIFVLIFSLQTLIWNLNRSFPKIPGDISIDRPGIRVYIPLLSTLLLSGAILIYFNFFR